MVYASYLPIAVQQGGEGLAVDAMSEAWDQHVGFGRARLTVDRT